MTISQELQKPPLESLFWWRKSGFYIGDYVGSFFPRTLYISATFSWILFYVCMKHSNWLCWGKAHHYSMLKQNISCCVVALNVYFPSYSQIHRDGPMATQAKHKNNTQEKVTVFYKQTIVCSHFFFPFSNAYQLNSFVGIILLMNNLNHSCSVEYCSHHCAILHWLVYMYANIYTLFVYLEFRF